MTLEQMEVQIADLLTKARKMQIRAQQLQRQGIMVARQGEVVVREKLNDYFEVGLNLLGKSIIKGRKIKETLTAQANRKIASIKKDENNTHKINRSNTIVHLSEEAKLERMKKVSNLKTQDQMIHGKSVIKKNNVIRAKKSSQHFSNGSRAR